MGNLYLAWYEVGVTTRQHAYLVYDVNEDLLTTSDQLIIRGGPSNPGDASGTIVVEEGVLSSRSSDGLDNDTDLDRNDHPESDKDENGVRDTFIDRHYTLLTNIVWENLVEFSTTLNSGNFTYDKFGPNSNSVINTVFNAAGLDFRDILPEGISASLFPGHMDLLDGSGDNTFIIYAYDGPTTSVMTFHKNAGVDTLAMEHDAKLDFTNGVDFDLTKIGIDANLADATFNLYGDDLVVNVTSSQNQIDIQNYASHSPLDQVEFLFNDFAYRRGTNGNDTMQSPAEKNLVPTRIEGLEGNDTLRGGEGGDILNGGEGNDALHGGGGSDTADYSSDASGVYVYLGGSDFYVGETSFAYDGWGDSDDLRSIENLVGSAYDDKFTMGSRLDDASRFFDGGDGIDVLAYEGYDSIIPGLVSRIVVDAASHTASELTATDTFVNIETFENVVYLPDLAEDYVFRFGTPDIIEVTNPFSGHNQSVITSYAHATQGGIFYLGGNVQADTTYVDDIAVSVDLTKSLNADITIGGVHHVGTADLITFRITDQNVIDLIEEELFYDYGTVYGSYFPTNNYIPVIAGTNFGDQVYLNSPVSDGDMEFVAGKGNDTIFGDFYNSYSASSVVYTGGTDSITGKIGTLRFAEYITEDQITVSGDFDGTYLHGDGVVTVAGLGTITINVDGSLLTGIDIPTGAPQFFDPLSGISFVAQTLTGDTADNYLFGSFGVDTISGGDGLDSLYGASGDDTISGDSGDDEIYGGIGNDILNGGVGADLLYGNAGEDTLIGGVGNDTLDGGAGDDAIDGGADIDTVGYANAGGAVRLYLGLTTAQDTGGGGTDTIINVENVTGSRFNDVIEGNAGNNYLYGGDGTDTLSYAHASSAVNVSLYAETSSGGGGNDSFFGFENVIGSVYNDTIVSSYTNNVIDGGTGNDTVSYASSSSVEVDLSLTGAQNTYGGGTDTLTSIENVIGSGYNDVLRGSNAGNSMNGGAGYDIIFGSAGTDILDGGADYDEVSYFFATSGVSVNLGTGSVTNDGMGSTDYLSNIEGAYGGAFDDVIIGSSSNNDLYGNAGNDRIEGGLGNDYIDGGASIDTASYAGANGGVTVNLAIAGLQNTVSAGNDTLLGIENIIGSAYGDTLTGDGADNTIDGGLGNDTLVGGSGSDTLSYRTATAAITVVMSTTSSQNTVNAGYDTISGFENYLGSNFGNTVSGTTGNNVIEGGNGNDTLNGGNGSDTLSYAHAIAGVTVSLATTLSQNTGGAGSDTISNFENLTGSSFDDNLTGNFANNIINGGAGNDVIIGGSADDTIIGGDGIDTVSYTDATGAVTVSLAVTSSQNTGNRGNDTIASVENLIGSTSYWSEPRSFLQI